MIISTQSINVAATIFLALALATGGLVEAAAKAKKTPVAMIMQAKGNVTYTKNSKKWKKVRKNKFLFAGYQVKTGSDGTGTVINQAKNTARTLGPNSVVNIDAEGVKLVSGELSDPTAATGNLVAGLSKRFAKAQRYTTVRRGVLKVEQKTIKKLTVSAAYPELVWQAFGPDYAFKLVIDGKDEMIAPKGGDMVVHKLSGLAPGEHSYRIEILKDGAVVYAPKRDGTLIWLSDDEESAYLASEEAMRKDSGGDDFLIAAHRDQNGLKVPAMRAYRKYFAANPDDNDMRPMLIKAYFDLKLKNLRVKEAGVYNEMASSDG